MKLTPSIHFARFAIAVGATGAEVTIGEAALKESMASMAIDEVRRKCMIRFLCPMKRREETERLIAA